MRPYLALHVDQKYPGHGASMLNSRSLLRQLRRKKAWQRLISRDRITDRSKWSWPENMEQMVLHHLRQSAFAKLKWVFSRPSAKLIKQVHGNKAYLQEDAYSLLRLRNHEVLTSAEEDKSTLTGKDIISSFNLPVLLGEHLLNELVQGTRFATSDVVAVTQSPLTVALLVRLSKLQSFVDDETDE